MPFPSGQLFQHVDGGFYQFEKSVRFADDDDELVVYAHIWPFPHSEAARRVNEFLEKFRPIEKIELDEAQKLSVQEYQEVIRNKKAIRKSLGK